MTETEQTQSEPTVADKRAALQRNGYPVATRGKLSAEAEQAYADLKANGKA